MPCKATSQLSSCILNAAHARHGKHGNLCLLWCLSDNQFTSSTTTTTTTSHEPQDRPTAARPALSCSTIAPLCTNHLYCSSTMQHLIPIANKSFFVVRSLCSALLVYFPLSLALSVTLSVSCMSLSQLNCRSLVNFFGPAVPVPSQCQCWLHPAEMHHLYPWDLRFI